MIALGTPKNRPAFANPLSGLRISTRSNEFQAGYSLDHGLALWDFDRRLRHLVLRGVEQIEVGVRVTIAYEVGRTGPFTYLDPQSVEPRSLIPKPRKSGIASSDFQEWVDRLDRLRADSREDFIAHYNRKYSQHSPQLPVWIAIELWDFGTLAHYYQKIMPYSDRLQVSQSFQVPNVKMLSSWLHVLNMVRNTAAHHSRLWNKPFVIQPITAKSRRDCSLRPRESNEKSRGNDSVFSITHYGALDVDA